MAEVVYEYKLKDAFTLKITGRNEWRYAAYCKRIGVAEGSEESKVEDVTPSGKALILPAFYETRYIVRCVFENDSYKEAFVNHKMASVAEAFDFDDKTLVGTLDFINSPGKFHFEIVWYRNGQRESAAFEWMVVSEKLNVQQDYKEIVSTIEKNAPGLVRAFLAKSKGEAGLINRSDTNDSIWADIFGEVADKYQRACEWITNRPHLKYVNEVEYSKAGRIKHWTPQLVNRYAAMSPSKRDVALYRTEIISPQIDTIENRFVKFTLKEITKKLVRFAATCREHGKTVSESFAKDLEERSEKLLKIARRPFFSGVGRFTGFKQESLAMQRKQGYADIFATWLMLQKTIDTTATGFMTGHRPISALYEFWCFLKIADTLETRFGAPSGKVDRAKVYDDLFEEPDPDKIDLQTLSALTYEFPEKDGAKIKLFYQQNYGESGKDGDLAYYNPQRPDIVLSIERAGETFTYLFDAKYRIDERKVNGEMVDASPAEPINDMHRYRDAILYRAQDGDKKLSRQIVGAYVLYPGRPTPHSYDYAELIKHENIGAIPLLPGEEGGAALVKFINEILGKTTPDSHLKDVIPTRGTTMVVGEAISEGEILDERMDASIHNKVIDKKICPIKADGRNLEGVKYARLICEGRAEVIVKLGAMLQNGQQCDLNAVFGGFEYNHDKFYFYQVEARVK